MDCWWTPDLRRSLGMDTAPLIETIRLVCRQYGSLAKRGLRNFRIAGHSEG
jgi:hypothetical protein